VKLDSEIQCGDQASTLSVVVSLLRIILNLRFCFTITCCALICMFWFE